MTNSIYKIALDIHDHGSSVSLKAKRGDTGRILHISLMDGRKPYSITGECYAVFTAKKADGNILFNHCDIIGNTICYAFTPQTTSAVGKAECEIKLYGAEDKLLTTAQFSLIVEDTVYNEGDEVESEKEVSALTALISAATALIRDKVPFENLTAQQRSIFMGDPGVPGPAGKSAYEYAKDGGYTGTEAEFAAKLAGEAYTYGTEDLVAGESELATGKLHFVYE